MRSWFKRGLFDSRRSNGLRAGVVLGENEFALAIVRCTGADKPTLLYCARHEAAGSIDQTLAALIQKQQLGRAQLSAVVGLEDYQLVQVEAPEVLPSELRAAVRWRLRDVISFHIDDAVVDVFEMPAQSRRAQTKMMFAVAARSQAVQRLAQTLAPAAKALDAIDIPELCLRNLASLVPQDQRGVAFLVLSDHSAQLLLTRQGMLYLARRIEFARSYSLNGGAAIDAGALALELQRSLDYYESHFDETPIGDLVIAPNGERASQLASAMKDETSLRISLLDVREILAVDASVQCEFPTPCLTAIGAALRVDSVKL